MRSKKLTEEEVFKLIQQQSIDFRESRREITEAILLAGELDRRVEKYRGQQKKSEPGGYCLEGPFCFCAFRSVSCSANRRLRPCSSLLISSHSRSLG